MNRNLLARLDRLGPVLVTAVILVLTLGYMAEAYGRSSRIHNIIMLVPMTAIVVMLSAIIFLKAARGVSSRQELGAKMELPSRACHVSKVLRSARSRR